MPRSNNRVYIALHSNPTSPLAEAYRNLRINIEFNAGGKEMKTIALLSANPGEGKSTTALNLATAYAQIGSRTLLIDADMRKPSLHTAFGIPNNLGLTHILAMDREPEETIQESGIPGLSILPSGPVPVNASELLASRKFDQLLLRLKEIYDIVLIDTPPALKVMDASIVASKADGAVIVVEYHKVKSDEARRLVEEMASVNANVLGVALNKINNRDVAVYP
ncbi:CpsD/CapB family tyrosine-protein kinase [Cohnella fermenti]|uniref:non-specific protein-tyrosine kinase n=1 Tax=Cohnella fermenti TaxID=2565925 RepID=A0A4S4BJY7_9BACL|nr:CpsD/CapB family tyrosine-protein kinase [Cohnella fermenti]THF74914.1 CpsD/CapB family tyrosine-protein kinase [Cohnella fermenti]